MFNNKSYIVNKRVKIKIIILSIIIIYANSVVSANQGLTDKISSASSNISLTILPKTINTGKNQLKFNSKIKTQISEVLCTNDFAAPIYSIAASGSGKNGSFVLGNTSDNESKLSINYFVDFLHDNQKQERLEVNSKISNIQNKINKSLVDCLAFNMSRIQVSLENNLKNEHTYFGYLILKIMPE